MASFKILIFVFVAVFAVALAQENVREKKGIIAGYAGYGYGAYPYGLGYSGLGYHGLGYGLGYHGLGYGLGYGYSGFHHGLYY